MPRKSQLALYILFTTRIAQAQYYPPSNNSASSNLDWLNVKTQYGARGDGGITDNQPKFQAAVNALIGLGSGTVYIPRDNSRYRLGSSVVLASNITVQCEVGAIIEVVGDFPAFTITNTDHVSLLGCGWQGSYLGTGTVPNQKAILGASGSTNVLVSDNVFTGLTLAAYFGPGTANLRYERNRHTNCHAGIAVTGDGTGGVSGVWIRDSRHSNSAATVSDDAIAVFAPAEDILIDGAFIDRGGSTLNTTLGRMSIVLGTESTAFTINRATISNSNIKNTSGSDSSVRFGAIYIAGTGSGAYISNVTLFNNKIQNSYIGIQVDGGYRDVAMIRNVVDTTQGKCVTFTGGSSSVNLAPKLTDDSVSNCGDIGISLTSVSNAKLIGETIYNTGNRGLVLDACVNPIVVGLLVDTTIAGQPGVYLNNSVTSVADSRIINAGLYGIQLNGSSVGTSVMNVQFFNNASTDLLDSGTNALNIRNVQGSQDSMPSIKSATGTRFVCIGTDGRLTSSASPCSGT